MDDAASYHEPPTERLDAMRRTVAKALLSSRHSSFYNSDCDEASQSLEIDELVRTIIFSLVRQSLQYLKEPEGEAAMACFVGLVARAVSREQVKVAIRLGVQEATSGLWDECHQKMDEMAIKVPRILLWMGLLVAGTYGILLAVGLLLSLWRYCLYGIDQEKNIL